MKKKIPGLRGLAVLVCVTLASPQAFTEETTKASLESKYIMESDAGNQSGQVQIAESEFLFEHEFKLENGMPVTVSLKNRHTDINSDAPVYLPSKLVGRSLGLGVKFPAPFTESDNYFFGLDLYPSMYTDDWNETSSSAFRIPGRAYLIYRRDENFIVFAGLSIRPEFDAKILPLIGFIYRPNDRLEFNFASSSPHVSFALSNRTKVVFEIDLVNDEYEVEYNGQKGRILAYKEFSAGVGLRHNFTQTLSGSVSVGSVFSRALRYEDDDNGEIEPESGMYVKAGFKLSF